MEASGELLFTILSCFAQEESRSISENTKWGIRSKFQQGIPHVNTTRLFGFDKDEEGQLRVNPEQGAVVRRIFREYLRGFGEGEIARRLRADGIPGLPVRRAGPRRRCGECFRMKNIREICCFRNTTR